jgi:hypothetical protein
MPNYQKGKIYKITTQQNDNIYIGSTCKSLNNRFADHKQKYNLWMRNNNKKSISSFELLGYDDCKIELIEDYPCESFKKLTEREGHHMKLHRDAIVNKHLLTRTSQEWRDEHKEDKLAYNKAYYEKNKEVIMEQHRGYIEANKEVIAVKRREYVDANYEAVRSKDNEAKRKKYMCEYCDKEISVGNKSHHEKTATHIKNYNSLHPVSV